MVIDPIDLEVFDRMTGGTIHGAGFFVGQVMAQVGANNDQCFRTTPQGVDNFRHCLRCYITHNKRHDGE